MVKLVAVREEDEEQRVFSAMLVNNRSCDFLPDDGRAGCGSLVLSSSLADTRTVAPPAAENLANTFVSTLS